MGYPPEAGHASPVPPLRSIRMSMTSGAKDSQPDEQGTVRMSKKKHEGRNLRFFLWARQDLNPRPSGYEPPALTS